MLANYLPVLIFLVVSAGLAGLLLLLGTGIGRVLARSPGGKEKVSPYECGFEAYEDTRMKFDVRYYLVAILFIVFDLEIAFLFPWAVALRDLGMVGFVQVVTFFALLVTGYIYVWRKGVLDWGPAVRRVRTQAQPRKVA